MNPNINSGLSNQEAEKRIKQYGYNEIKKEKKFKALRIFLNQFNNPLIWLLLCAAVLAYFTEGQTESIIIFVILTINSFIGFFQEYWAEKTLQLLNKYIIHTAKVIRDNQITEIHSKYLVPGDVIPYTTFGFNYFELVKPSNGFLIYIASNCLLHYYRNT